MNHSSWRTIRLMRHLKPNWPTSMLGYTDASLDDTSLEQWTQHLPQHLPNQSLVSSPLQRCLQMAERMSQKYHWPLQTLASLQEMDFGRFDGMPFSDLAPHWELLERFWQDPFQNPLPEAESLEQFQQRVLGAWQQLIDLSREHDLFVVCHGGVIRNILAHLLHADWRQGDLYQRFTIDYGSISEIRVWHQASGPVFQLRRIAVPYADYRYES